MGTYQRRKRRNKRMTQVKTNNPIKILFLGLISNVVLVILSGMKYQNR